MGSSHAPANVLLELASDLWERLRRNGGDISLAAQLQALGGHRLSSALKVNSWEFLERWESWYPQSVPVGHLLRERHPGKWLRIYSLPDGQRYPESEADWAELLRRHSATGDAVLGKNAECAFIAAWFGAQTADEQFVRQFNLVTLALIREDFPHDGSDPADHAIDLHWTVTHWDPGQFATAIRMRAEDRAPSFLFVALETGNVYAPYDGGADLFAVDSDAKLRIWHALRAWLSPRRDGL